MSAHVVENLSCGKFEHTSCEPTDVSPDTHPETDLSRETFPDTVSLTAITRFWQKIDRHSGPVHPTLGRCWVWIGSRQPEGYGTFFLGDDKTVNAHRFSFQVFVGAIPPGLQADHLCFNPWCVCPDHLEVVTCAENLRRSRIRRPSGPYRCTTCRVLGHNSRTCPARTPAVLP